MRMHIAAKAAQQGVALQPTQAAASAASELQVQKGTAMTAYLAQPLNRSGTPSHAHLVTSSVDGSLRDCDGCCSDCSNMLDTLAVMSHLGAPVTEALSASADSCLNVSDPQNLS